MAPRCKAVGMYITEVTVGRVQHTDKEYDKLLAMAVNQGHTVTRTANGHYRVEFRDGKGSVILPGTPSDHRSILNCIADLKRLGLVMDKDYIPPEIVEAKAAERKKSERISTLYKKNLIVSILEKRYPSPMESADLRIIFNARMRADYPGRADFNIGELGATLNTLVQQGVLTRPSRYTVRLAQAPTAPASAPQAPTPLPVLPPTPTAPVMAPQAAPTQPPALDANDPIIDEFLNMLAKMEAWLRELQQTKRELAKLKALLGNINI